MSQLERRKLLIVGAASGIGAAGARHFAELGWHLALLDHNAQRLRDVADEVAAASAEVVDVAEAEQLEAAVTAAGSALGGLDGVWSNAGVQLSGDVGSLSVDDLDRSYAVNLRAHFVIAKSAVRTMAAGSSILITASNSGLQTEPNALAYATTKAAAIALMKGLARDLAPRRIRVNALCPGYVDTPFNAPIWESFGGREGFLEQVGSVIPLGTMATPEEMAALAEFLLDPRSASITGHALVADGGELIG